jgi:hypothetical protein
MGASQDESFDRSYLPQAVTAPPNDMRISCGPSSPCPHKPTFHSALLARCARAEGGAHSGPSAACTGLGGGRPDARTPSAQPTNQVSNDQEVQH